MSLTETNVLYQILKNIGLDDFSIEFYEYLLNDLKHQDYTPSSGLVKMKINILEASQKLGVARIKIYNSLEVLAKNQLVEFLENSKNNFILNSVEVIKAKLLAKEAETKRLVNSFDEFLPDLIGKYSSFSKKSYVTKLEGRNNFIYYINQLIPKLERHSVVLAFAEGENFYDRDFFSYLLNVWQVQRVAKKVNIKILLQQNNVSFLPWLERNEEDLRQTKFLSKDVDAQGCFWIVNNELIHFDTALNRVIAIEDRALAKLHTQLFEQVWGS